MSTKNTSPLSIRMDEVTRERFREAAAGGQQVVINQMLDLLDLEMAKETVPGQATAIDGFRAHADALVTSYVAAHKACNNAKDRIRGEFSSNIESKDKLIRDLQKTIKNQEKAVANSKTSMEENPLTQQTQQWLSWKSLN
ncbi:hypothetical protein [Eubacterium limosum]|uniref:hypothetical protein n=1 Tax=Eubacterium limosum TaxID=1736 RepID=UPI003712AD8E